MIGVEYAHGRTSFIEENGAMFAALLDQAKGSTEKNYIRFFYENRALEWLGWIPKSLEERMVTIVALRRVSSPRAGFVKEDFKEAKPLSPELIEEHSEVLIPFAEDPALVCIGFKRTGEEPLLYKKG